MKYPEPASVSIFASAGYGKTEILCMRLLAIYLADPENIRKTSAMTFTRSAAGEMLERTFMLAAKGLNDEDEFVDFRKKLINLNEMEIFQQLTREELEQLLVLLAEKLRELNISTIDSFMVSMAGAYPMELGFFRQPALVSEDQGKAISAEIIRNIFAMPDEKIVATCRESIIGQEKRQYADACAELLASLEQSQDLMPDRDAWGTVPDAELTNTAVLQQCLDECDRYMPAAADLYQQKLRPLLERCASIQGAQEYFSGTELETMKKFFAVWQDFPQEKPEGFKRGWDFTNCHQAIRTLLSRGRDILLIQTGVRTRAAYDLLVSYQALYREKMWNRGLIQFQDLPKLLNGLPDGGLNDLQYRMNMKFHHFLFDEFQDTSRRQWQVFSPIVQDNGEENHSLFLVGDIKQAIYSWRGGDSRLMGEVSRDLPCRALPFAFRYGQAICNALNHLFTAGVANCPAIRRTVKERWLAEFREHEPYQDRPGCFVVNTFLPQDKDCEQKEDVLDTIAGMIAERLRTIQAKERKLSCAILVRNNPHGIALRNALSAQPGFEPGDFIWEGDESIANDRVNAGLLTLLCYLQHPADTGTVELLRMDPVLQKLLPENDREFTELHTRLTEMGLTAFLCECFRKISGLTGDEPGISAEALLNAAREFETANPRADFAEFREFARRRKRSEAALAGKIRLMSIHHSKGLTFDVTFYVMFPEKHGNFRTLDHSGILMGENWLLHQAGAAGLTLPTVRQAAEERDAIRKFEMLCLLYVALTRAKREVQVLIPSLSNDKFKHYHPDVSTLQRFKGRQTIGEQEKLSFTSADLVFDAFFQDKDRFPLDHALPLWRAGERKVLRREFGNSQWYINVHPEPPKPQVPLFPLPESEGRESRPLRAAPSKLDEDVVPHFRFPSRTGSKTSGTTFGTDVHALFEKVDKWSSFQPAPDTAPEVQRHWEMCNANTEIARLLSAECELWRERRFDIILRENGLKVFLSGCFDRVQIYRDEFGNVERAEIIDFKSNDVTRDNVAGTAQHYQRQMDSYRRALAQLLHLPPEKITSYLLFSKIGVLHRMEQ